MPPYVVMSNTGSGEALIDVKGGDLVLTGVEIQRDASTHPST